jgi:uncharacterized coiled-coil protein SlyX
MTATVLSLAPLGQSQDSATQSVAEAARRAREQKKSAAKQPAPVITNDTLKPAPASDQANNTPAPTPAAQPDANSSSAPDHSATPAGQPAPASGDATDQKAKDSSEVAAMKQQLAEAQKALDLLQRNLALQQDTYISNPDHAHDIAGKAKLDEMLQQIAGSQQTVDALKAQLAALLASTSGGTTPPPPTTPPQP